MKKFNSELEKVVYYLENGNEGDYVENEETGVSIEITNMVGGRYLVCDKHGEPIRATDNAVIAYKYIK